MYRNYGAPSVVHVKDVPTPEPRADEVLVRVRATAVSSADFRARSDVIDYKLQSYTDASATYDVIVDTVGFAPVESCKRLLGPRGRLVLIAASVPQLLSAKLHSLTRTMKRNRRQRPRAPRRSHLAAAARGSRRLPPADRPTYPLADIQRAHARVDTGHKCGSVVIAMDAS